eukprot:Protomagalhaensia_wolfi_Nauph_80__756@NODE_1434_length_1533_cov_98_083668_g1108_i0_p2_GENE_NODE_1434_length_1533_cov_98_083668_g1108_i0NODE_1434_length_1533_cov_98_083668_g1108_i0_p2_ORF_typecomplete_len140_score14_57Rab5ip/PF07019_12/3_7e12EI24/PF07264_11/1_4_NODE_1434_length_1533_cov_98_083668_g1108_i010361455
MLHPTPQAKKALTENNVHISTMRHVSALLSGAVAGILGCETWVGGILFYLLVALLVTPTLYVLTVHVMTLVHDAALRHTHKQLAPRPALLSLQLTVGRYYPSLLYLYTSQLMTGILSYILTWTLTYNMVYVFKACEAMV